MTTACDKHSETHDESSSGSESNTDTETYKTVDPWDHMVLEIRQENPDNFLVALQDKLWYYASMMHELKSDKTFSKIKQTQRQLMRDDHDFDEALRKSIQSRSFLLQRIVDQYNESSEQE